MIFSKILRKGTFSSGCILGRNISLSQNFQRHLSAKNDNSPKERGPRPNKEQSYTAFLFDSENKTSIFEHLQGEVKFILRQSMSIRNQIIIHFIQSIQISQKSDLRLTVRVFTVFTILNSILAIGEYQYPIFGGWNGLSFSLCALTGIGLMSFMSIFSKRTIHSIKLLRSGDQVEVNFFNAFWIPQTKHFHVSEFANMQASFVGYSRTELTTYGKVWINLEKNAYYGNKAYEDILISVLNGNQVKLDSFVQQRAAEYLKKK